MLICGEKAMFVTLNLDPMLIFWLNAIKSGFYQTFQLFEEC